MAADDLDRIEQALAAIHASESFGALGDASGADIDELIELVTDAVFTLHAQGRGASSSSSSSATSASGPDGRGHRGDADGQGLHGDAVGQDDRANGFLGSATEPSGSSRSVTLAGGAAVLTAADDVPLTTTKAAALIGVSRPFLISLLEKGIIPFHKVGRDRRIQLSDVRTYLADRDEAKEQYRQAAQRLQ